MAKPCNSDFVGAARSGFALPAVLALISILTLVATAATTTAIANLQLSGSMLNSQDAFRLATFSIEQVLHQVATDPGVLPANGDTTPVLLSVTNPGTHSGSVNSEIRWLRSDNECTPPAVDTLRRHYEIRVSARAGRGAGSHQRQGFFVCNEACTAPPCVAGKPVQSYWYVTAPDQP